VELAACIVKFQQVSAKHTSGTLGHKAKTKTLTTETIYRKEREGRKENQIFA
jgi:hypothetical protein